MPIEGKRKEARSRLWRVLALFTAFALLAAACGDDDDAADGGAEDGEVTDGDGDPAEGEPYKIALVADLVGTFATIEGLSATAGMRAAVAEINNDGGINGHPIDLSVHDAQSTVEGAQAATRAAINDEPHAVVVASLSAETAAAIPILEQVEIPTISVAPLSNLLFPDPLDWYFTTSNTPVIGEFSAECARFAAGGDLDGARIAYQGLVSSNVDTFFEASTVRLEEAGAEIVAEERRPGDQQDFAAQAQSLVGADPDVIVMHDGESGAVTAVDALETAGYDGPICIGESVATQAFFEEFQDPDLLAVRLFQDPVDAPLVIEALEEAGQDTTGGFLTVGWTLSQLLGEAFRDCELPCDSETLIGSLESVGDYAPPGDVVFTPIGYSPEKHWFINSVQYFAWDDEEGTAVPVDDLLIDVSEVEALIDFE